ncbi:hypothetical protein FRC19_004439 [Serendipita sp. 401]|nr:hypothetical protein FRC19_004439 [Serendipita sp. 401]
MSVTSGEQLVEKYLAAYKAYDLAAMDACTDPEFTFSDPAFPSLNSKQAKGMFSMFVNNREKNKMELEYKDIKKGINDLTYTATYTVRYIFTGRPVTNVIQSTRWVYLVCYSAGRVIYSLRCSTTLVKVLTST